MFHHQFPIVAVVPAVEESSGRGAHVDAAIVQTIGGHAFPENVQLGALLGQSPC